MMVVVSCTAHSGSSFLPADKAALCQQLTGVAHIDERSDTTGHQDEGGATTPTAAPFLSRRRCRRSSTTGAACAGPLPLLLLLLMGAYYYWWWCCCCRGTRCSARRLLRPCWCRPRHTLLLLLLLRSDLDTVSMSQLRSQRRICSHGPHAARHGVTLHAP